MLNNNRLVKKAMLRATASFAGARETVAVSKRRKINHRFGYVLFKS